MTSEEQMLALLERQEQREKQKQAIAGIIFTPFLILAVIIFISIMNAG